MYNGNRYFQPCSLAAITEANKSHIKYKHNPANKAKKKGNHIKESITPLAIPPTNIKGTRWRKPIDSLST